MIDLRVSLSLDGRQYYFNTRRLIYITFRNNTLNYETDGLYVINIDGDGYNNAGSNLKAVTKSEKQQRVFKRGRLDSYLKTADRSKWKTMPGYSRRKPVKQYTLKNKLVARYISVKEAVEKTGFDEKGIIGAAKGHIVLLKFRSSAYGKSGRRSLSQGSTILPESRVRVEPCS